MGERKTAFTDIQYSSLFLSDTEYLLSNCLDRKLEQFYMGFDKNNEATLYRCIDVQQVEIGIKNMLKYHMSILKLLPGKEHPHPCLLVYYDLSHDGLIFLLF